MEMAQEGKKLIRQDIRTIRTKLGLSQAKFAEELGVRRLAIARWESGTRTPDETNQKRLLQIAKENGLDTKLENVSSNDKIVSSKVDTLDTKLDTRDTKNVSKLDTKSDKVDTKLENVSKQLDTTFPTGYNFDNIPNELKEYPHWVCWAVEQRAGKETKVPYSPHGGKAKADDPSTWGTFEQAKTYLEQHENLAGIGYVFSADDPFCGIDLDKCRDAESGIIETDAQKIIEDFGSYTEISPSGRGVHIIISGKKEGNKCRKDKIEIYDSERYFTVTGNVLNEHGGIEERQEQLDKLYDSLFAQREEKSSASKQPAKVSLDDRTIIEKAKRAKDGAKFTALWEGNIEGYRSQSEADLALCCLLAFWTGGDDERIDRLFRQSGLNRAKLDREDYVERTIDAALECITEFYEPNGNNTSPKAVAQEVDLFQKKKTKEDFSPYFKKDTFIPKLLADDILSDNRFINVKGLLYRYENGVYRDDGEQFIAAESQNKLGNESRQNRISETVYYIKVDSYTEPERVNPTDKGNLINLTNGLYDWIKDELLPHNPDHLSTIRIPIEYNPEATCPTVDYFLESTLPKDCIPIAEELFGYVLIPYVRFEKAFMFTGNGANGKSTFLTLLEKFVGSDNVSKIPLQELDEHRFKRADLFGKLVNLFADLDARDVQSSTYFKTIVSGDSIDAERKHQDPFFFRPFARLAFSANEIPRSPDNSYAYFRRWVIVPFPHRFEGRDADKSLADKMIEPKELSGLLNHALKGLHRLFEQEEFSESTTIKASLEDYKKQNDTVAAFVNDCCIFDSNVEVERGELYTAYGKYCEDEGYKAISRRACYDRMRTYSQVGERKEPKNRYFSGILVKQ